jgi:prepilin-type N-terminal cleavage/methylation domain-containing protein
MTDHKLSSCQSVANKVLSAFTLVELLVVISIISLLLSILMPTLSKAREIAKNVVCTSNLKSIGTSIIVYTMSNDNLLPPGAVCIESKDRNGNGHLYWSDVALETSDKTGINYAAMRPPKGVINCPSKKFVQERNWGKYGYGWNFDYFGYTPSQQYEGWATNITKVEDPKTIIVGDNSDFHESPVWAKPTVIEPAANFPEYETRRHKSGGNFVSVDCHVEHLTWKAIFEDRDAIHYGLSSRWSGSYDTVINSLFTPARD